MKRNIHFVNRSSKNIYLELIWSADLMEIHVHDQPGDNRHHLAVSPNRPPTISVDVSQHLSGKTFQYAIHGHCEGIILILPTTAEPHGPVFTFTDPQ
jgi:hypothetical protein